MLGEQSSICCSILVLYSLPATFVSKLACGGQAGRCIPSALSLYVFCEQRQVLDYYLDRVAIRLCLLGPLRPCTFSFLSIRHNVSIKYRIARKQGRLFGCRYQIAAFYIQRPTTSRHFRANVHHRHLCTSCRAHPGHLNWIRTSYPSPTLALRQCKAPTK